MPDLTKTTAGITRLLQAGVNPTHLEYGSTAVAADDLDAQTSVGGVLATATVTEAVVGNESQFIGVDDTDANAYTNFRTLGLWHVPAGSNPGDTGSVLLAIGSTGDATTYGDKVMNIDLIVAGSVQLTDAQAANITFGSGTVLQATETRHGTTRYGTEAEAQAGARADRSASLLNVAQYVAAWWAALSIPASKITGVLATARIPNLSAAKINSGILAVARIPNLSASKITSGMLAFVRLPAATETAAKRANSGDNDSLMSPYRTTQHFEARVKIQDTDPGASDADATLSQIWLVHP